MSDAYDKISKFWSKFPEELKNSSLYCDLSKSKNIFEDKKDFFGDYLTKIVIIGNVSTGKSTLINTLLGKEYFGSKGGNGTVSFFYCSLSEKNYEYFTVNNCQVEHKDISILKDMAILNVHLTGFINQESVLKIYMKHDEYKILERKTVIVDCPGLGHDEKYDKAINNHCSNADMFIFMFQINEPTTINQRNHIKTIRHNFRNPTCFFVYNKCDLPDFNDEQKNKLRTDFIDLFGEQYFRSLKLNSEPLYFISALNPNEFEDFSRLKADILVHKNVNFVRIANVQSILLDEINKYYKCVGEFVYEEQKKKITILKTVDEMRVQIKNYDDEYSEFLNYVKRRIENSEEEIQQITIFKEILEIIDKHNGKCKKENASQMILNIEINIRSKIVELMGNHLKDSCIDPINKRMLEVNSNDPTGISMDFNKNFYILPDQLNLPQYDNIKTKISRIDVGDITKKVKTLYTKFMMSEDNKKQIRESIINLYKNKFSKIEEHYKELVQSIRKNHKTAEQKFLNENLIPLENKLKILANYEKEVKENVKRLNSSLL